MKKSLNKLINKAIYENEAEYPWARFKDFILSEDGKSVEKVIISSESLIPLTYAVNICDFKIIGGKKSVLKTNVKPALVNIDKNNPYALSNIKKYSLKKAGLRGKISDMSFDSEFGEIIDFIITPSLIGKKTFINSGEDKYKTLMEDYLKSKNKI